MGFVKSCDNTISPNESDKTNELGDVNELDEANKLDVKQYLGFVLKIAERLSINLPHSICLEDLVQEGMLALLEIYSQYNKDNGVSLEAYASLRVRGAMIDLLRRSMPLSKEKIALVRKSQQFVEDYQHRFETKPKELLIAERLGITLDKYRSLLVEYESCVSSNIDDNHHLELAEDYLENVITKKMLTNSFKKLSKRERKVIALYYVDELTLSEVGERLNISESRVSQINKSATNKLRDALKALSS